MSSSPSPDNFLSPLPLFALFALSHRTDDRKKKKTQKSRSRILCSNFCVVSAERGKTKREYVTRGVQREVDHDAQHSVVKIPNMASVITYTPRGTRRIVEASTTSARLAESKGDLRPWNEIYFTLVTLAFFKILQFLDENSRRIEGLTQPYLQTYS